MTMPDERTRALIWAGEFLRRVAYSHGATPELREQAVCILRHYPSEYEIDTTVKTVPGITEWLLPISK